MVAFASIFLIFNLLLIVLLIENGSALSCRDAKNEDVDWYYLYKLPNVDNRDGLDYVYITSNSDDYGVWSESNIKINNAMSIPGRTISQLYGNESLVVAMYNDELPNGKVNAVKGHTKGVIASDANTGFWLIHSVPRFPPDLSTNAYDYPKTAHIYGQSFLCITMSADQINSAGIQLMYNDPVIYSSNAPDNLKKKFPNLYNVINNNNKKNKSKTESFANMENLISVGGTKFKSFAKAKKFGMDLYEDLVAPTLKSDFYVETWQHGSGNLPSNCTLENKIYNVEKVNLKAVNCEFGTMHDHSKWAVSVNYDVVYDEPQYPDDDEKNDWICVGDINRQKHQKIRAGGTVCQKNIKLAKAYQGLVADVQPCPRKSVSIDVILKV